MYVDESINIYIYIIFIVSFSYIFKMVKKIVISRFNNIAAILQNNRIQELITIHNGYQVNDIYIGIVQKIFSSINAAFVKIGKDGKSGFIHANDIQALKKNKHITHVAEILSLNQIILVQVIKEPTSQKGPRLTTNINLSGKYIVLMPFCNTVCVSEKIYDQNERIHLHSLGILLKPTSMGILIRSSAQGIDTNTIIEDLKSLKKQWNFIEKAAISTHLPCLIYKEEDLIKKIICDSYETSVKKIIIDSEDGLQEIKYYLKKWNCLDNINQIKLQLYNKPECLLEKFKIKRAILEALKAKVNLESGGHIVIENNEALTVIDVNSGSFNKADNSKETILRTNLYAASEIAYQIKIRNLNGVIIIDFIDMKSPKDQLKLLEHLSQLLKLDNAKPQIIQLSELGLVELTRRRRGQSLEEIFKSKNHSYLNLDQNLMFKYEHYNSHIEWKSYLLINKNIKSLFFRKIFRKNLALHKKFLHGTCCINCKAHICLDKINTIKLIQLNKNFFVPLTLYTQII